MIYSNYSCPVCGERFKPDDDIVVCPDCGTPHHRSCYFSTGICFNSQKHSPTFQWDEPAIPDVLENPDEQSDIPSVKERSVTCPKCGNANCKVNSYCDQCGHLILAFDLPSEDKLEEKSEFDDIPAEKLKSAIGRNYHYYFYHFDSQDRRNTKISLNVIAFLFPSFFFLYRRMKKEFLAVFAAMTILQFPVFIDLLLINAGKGNRTLDTIAYILVFFALILRVVTALLANWQYRKHLTSILADESATIVWNEKRSLLSVLGAGAAILILSYVVALIIL